MSRIVIATCLKLPEVSQSDQVLVDALKSNGAEVVIAPWNGPFDPFADPVTNLVVLRTTWDYFDVVDAFYGWFDQLEKNKIQVANSLQILRWNARKNYLFELQKKGLPVIESVEVVPDVDDILEKAKKQGWQQAVLKCLVSGGAMGMSLLDATRRSDVKQALVAAAPFAAGGLMLQHFLPEIRTAGELSLVFIGGEFAHAICKTPVEGEFRIQSEFGGNYERVEVSESVLETARSCLNATPGMPSSPPLYARVDGLVLDGEFKLMELELTEPELMFDLAPESALRMADLIINAIARS